MSRRRCGPLVGALSLPIVMLVGCLALTATPAAAATGDINEFAGTGTPGNTGDGGPAVSATIEPYAIDTDAFGNVYVLSIFEDLATPQSDNSVRKIATNGTISTIVGGGTAVSNGPIAATSVELRETYAMAVDPAGNVYLGSPGRIRKVGTDGVWTTIAGNGVAASVGDGGPAAQAGVLADAMDVDRLGQIWIVDTAGHRVRKIGTNGIITTVAGTGVAGFLGDGGPATSAQLYSPTELAVSEIGELYIVDSGAVRKVATNGTITTVAGEADNFGNTGDGGPATDARFLGLGDIDVDSSGQLFVLDSYDARVRRIATNGTIDAYAGIGLVDGVSSGSGGPATAAELASPWRFTSAGGHGFVIERGTVANKVRKITGVTATKPAAPTAVTATSSPSSALVTWTAPANPPGAPVLGYIVTASPGGQSISTGTSTSVTFPGLTDGTNYTFTVRARNAGGAGAASAPSAIVTPRSPPGPPTNAFASPGNASAQLTWTAPTTTGGTSITGYRITASPGGITATIAGGVSAGTIGGLTNATSYTFTVQAQNSVGFGAPSAATVAVTPGPGPFAPAAPTALAATAASSSAGLTWVAPAFTGGASITGYRVTASPGSAIFDVGNVTSANFPALNDGTPYTFTIQAKNSAGTGTASARSNTVIPAGPGDIISILGGNTAGVGQPATSVGVTPSATAQAPDGTVAFVDTFSRIRRVMLDGTLTTIVNQAAPNPPQFGGDGGPAVDAFVASVRAIAYDSAGNLFIADTFNFRIRKVTPAGVISTIAGSGKTWNPGDQDCEPVSGDGGQATSATLCLPSDVAVDAAGNVYVADTGNYRIRKITPQGVISTVVGSGAWSQAPIPDDAIATSIGLDDISGLTVDTTGRPVFSKGCNVWVRTAANRLQRIAGTSGCTGDPSSGEGGPATSAEIYPGDVSYDGAGNLYFAGVYRILRVDPLGVLTRFAGAGVNGEAGDGGQALSAAINGAPMAAPNGTVYVTGNRTLRKIAINGVITTIAGNGQEFAAGDGVPGTSVTMRYPHDIALDPSGNVFVTENGERIRKLAPNGIVTTVAGNAGSSRVQDGSQATSGAIMPGDVAADGSGNVYFIDSFFNGIGYTTEVRKIAPDGTISTVLRTGATNGTRQAAATGFSRVATGPSGSIYVTGETGGGTIFKMTSAGVVTPYAGGGSDPVADGVPALTAQLSAYADISLDITGNLFLADLSYVRKVTTGGTITVIAGTGSPIGEWADGAAAKASSFQFASGVSVDAAGVVYVSDGDPLGPSDGDVSVVRKITGGLIYTVAGTAGVPHFGGDGGPAVQAGLWQPTSVAAFPDGSLVIADWRNHRVRKVLSVPPAPVPPTAPTNVVATLAGNTATVTWSAATSPPAKPVTAYTVTASPGGLTCTWSTGPRSCAIAGLTYGATYTFTVRAANIDGQGPASTPSNAVTPVAVPGPPINANANAVVAAALVTWDPPLSNGGLVITGYTVTAAPGGATCTTSGATSCTVSGLTNGVTYTFTVRAQNSLGFGPASLASNAVTPLAGNTAPSAPTAVVATAGNGSASVSWTAPTSNGGATIIGYVVTASPGGATCITTGALTCTVNGLINGVTYTFTVKAQNALGFSPASLPSNAVTPTAPVPTGVLFHALTPARILDSRANGPQVGPYSSPWSAGTSRDVQVTGVGNVPANADAVVLNVTATGTTGSSFLTMWPAGQAQPLASSLNWVSGQIIPNAVTVKVGAGGKVSVFNLAGTVHVVVDVVGYYDQNGGDGYTSLPPARILDSRANGPQVGPYGSPWSAGTSRDVQVTGVGNVPANADAVVLNVTATATTGSSFLTMWPAGQARPLASSLNWVSGQIIANAVTVKVGAGGKVSVFNLAGTTDVVIDVVGYFAVGSGFAFHPLAPARVQDSRPNGPQVGPYSTPWTSDTVRSVVIGGKGGVPVSADAVLVNATATGATASSYLTVWPWGQSRPLASSLNWVSGQIIPNAVTTKLGANGAVGVYNLTGNVDVVIDVAGWYG